MSVHIGIPCDAEWSSISDVICWVALCSFFSSHCCFSFFFLPGFFHLFFPSSILPSSKLLFPFSSTPWSTFPSIICAPSSTIWCSPSSVLLSPFVFTPPLSLSFFSSYLSLFPFSHLLFVLCAPLFSRIAPHFCHSTPLLPMHCNAPPFTPLIAFCGSFFHLSSPPPLLSTAATKTPPPRNVSMDHLYAAHSFTCLYATVMGRQTTQVCLFYQQMLI